MYVSLHLSLKKMELNVTIAKTGYEKLDTKLTLTYSVHLRRQLQPASQVTFVA